MAVLNIPMDGTWKELTSGDRWIGLQLRHATTLTVEFLDTAPGLSHAQVEALGLDGITVPVSSGTTDAVMWNPKTEAIYARANDGVLVVMI